MTRPDRSDSPDRGRPKETRARRNIRRAAEQRGWAVEYVHWSPITAGGEKEGAGGGWEVWVNDRHGEYLSAVLGYNWREVVEAIAGLSDA